MARVGIFVDAGNMFYAQKDNGWHIDFKKVYEYFAKQGEIVVAAYFTGTPHYQAYKEIGAFRKFRSFLVRTGYRVIDKELKRIKHKKPEDVLIDEKTINEIIQEKETEQGKMPEEIILNSVKIKLFKGCEDKADLDVNITLHMVAESNHYDRLIFLGGDGDFEPLLAHLRALGKYIICVAREQSTAFELKNTAHEFIDLNSIREEIEKN